MIKRIRLKGKWYDRIPYDDNIPLDRYPEMFKWATDCLDCECKKGEYHEHGCFREICPCCSVTEGNKRAHLYGCSCSDWALSADWVEFDDKKIKTIEGSDKKYILQNERIYLPNSANTPDQIKSKERARCRKIKRKYIKTGSMVKRLKNIDAAWFGVFMGLLILKALDIIACGWMWVLSPIIADLIMYYFFVNIFVDEN